MTTMNEGPAPPVSSTSLDGARRQRRQTPDHTRPVSSIRVVLTLGFTAVFALWLAWGLQLVRNLEHIEGNVETLQRNYTRGEEALLQAMNNVAPHSGATACMVTINTVARGLQLVIDDNGSGLKASHGHGLGLIAMRERAVAQGGSLTIESPVTGGTRVIVTMEMPDTVPVLAHGTA